MPTRSRICLPRCCRQQRVRISVREQDPRCPGAYTVGHVPGDLLDLILIVLIIAFGVAGYRQGFIIGILSFVGFIGGGAIGVTVAPRIARSIAVNPAWQAVAAVVTVFLAAMVGQLIASLIGVAMRSRVTWRPATVVDAVGGAAVSPIAVLLIAWVIRSGRGGSSRPPLLPPAGHTCR